MVELEGTREESGALLSLWLVVKYEGTTYAYEMVAGANRAVTVGSSDHVDIRTYQPDVPPIACFFERVCDEIWLVPGYRGQVMLRVDTQLIEIPQRIWRRAIVELPNVTLEVRVREEPPTNPDNAPPIRYGVLAEPSWSRARETGVPLLEQDLVCGGLAEAQPDSLTMRISTRRFQSQVPIPSRVANVSCPSEGVSVALEPSAILSVGEPLSSYPVPSSSAPVVMVSGAPLSLPPQSLARLGTFATRRPLLTLLGAIMGAVVLTGGMLGAAKAIESVQLAQLSQSVGHSTGTSNELDPPVVPLAAPGGAAPTTSGTPKVGSTKALRAESLDPLGVHDVGNPTTRP